MIAAAESVPDAAEGAFRELSGQIHRDLARERDVFRPTFAVHVRETEIVVLDDALLDQIDADAEFALFLKRLAEKLLDVVHRKLALHQIGIETDADQSPFQTSEVGPDAVGDEPEDLVGDVEIHQRRLLADDCEPGFVIGLPDLRRQTPLKARDQPLFQVLDLADRTITRDDDLLMVFVERVEGVEELLLDTLFAGEELDVIDQENVHLAIPLPETPDLVVLDRLDVFVGELLRRDVEDFGSFPMRGDVLANRLKQMGFPQADAAVEEEGIVGTPRCLGHGQRSGMGLVVAVTHHEGLERILRVEAEFPADDGGHGRRRSLNWGGFNAFGEA